MTCLRTYVHMETTIYPPIISNNFVQDGHDFQTSQPGHL